MITPIPNNLCRSLGISPENNFIKVNKNEEIISYCPSFGKDVEKKCWKQILLLSKLAECLRNISPNLERHYADCIYLNSTLLNEKLCFCLKVNVIFQKILNENVNNLENLSNIADEIDFHIENYIKEKGLSNLNSEKKVKEKRERFSKHSKNRGALKCCKNVFIKRRKPLDHLDESPLANLSTPALEVCRFYWSHVFAHSFPKEKIHKESIFQSLIKGLSEEELSYLTESAFPQPRMKELLEIYIGRTLSSQKVTSFTLGQDIDRVLTSLTFRDNKDNELKAEAAVKEDLTSRFIFMKKAIELFCSSYFPIANADEDSHESDKVVVDPSIYINKFFGIYLEEAANLESKLLENDEMEKKNAYQEAFASTCQALIEAIRYRSEVESPYLNQYYLLKFFLESFTQNIFTIPAHCILELFPKNCFEIKKGSTLINYTFGKNIIYISSRIGLSPAAQLINQIESYGTKHFGLIIKNNLRGQICTEGFQWSSTINVQFQGAQEAIPEFVTKCLVKTCILADSSKRPNGS